MITTTTPLIISHYTHTSTTVLNTLSLHDALPIWISIPTAFALKSPRKGKSRTCSNGGNALPMFALMRAKYIHRSEEHTSELQSLRHLVCRLLLEKIKKDHNIIRDTEHLSVHTLLE